MPCKLQIVSVSCTTHCRQPPLEYSGVGFQVPVLVPAAVSWTPDLPSRTTSVSRRTGITTTSHNRRMSPDQMLPRFEATPTNAFLAIPSPIRNSKWLWSVSATTRIYVNH